MNGNGNGRLGRILDAIMGRQPIFGYEMAETIYDKTAGRYDGDGSKAVPFAIVATAEALGSRVAIQEEAVDRVAAIDDQADAAGKAHAALLKKATETIRELESRIADQKKEIGYAEAETTAATNALTQKREKATKVAKFFKI